MASFKSVFADASSDTPLLMSTVGSGFALELLLDSHQGDIFGTERGSFWLRMTQFHAQFDMSEGTQVQTGRKNVLLFSYRV